VRPGRAAMLLGAAGAAAFAYGVVVERRWYALRHETVPALPAGWTQPVRILHLSDLHMWPGLTHMRDFIARAAACDPDVVVATGDLLGHPAAIDDVVDALGAANRGRPGLAVLGSHDFYYATAINPLGYFRGPSGMPKGPRHDTGRLVAGLEAAGWAVLENARTKLDTAAGPLDVVGLSDPHIRRDRADEVDWTPPGEEVLRLGLVHAPCLLVLDRFADEGLALTLAGHTHGGQVRMPGVGALVDNCDLPLGQARWLSRHRDMWLHVSAGLGTSRYSPFRFCCRPEATVLDLTPRS
jgi:uncharacterized protein